MKLLILTQKVDINDDLLGFFHSWISELAKRCENVTVICLQKGEYNFPDNVKILSLGKEKTKYSRFFCKIKYIYNFYRYIIRERENYNNIFVHMNSEYVVLGGFFWKLWNKKIGLWHAHGHAPAVLKIAARITDVIFTSTKSGCRLKSNKIKIVGQGIDTNIFKAPGEKLKANSKDGIFKMVTIGRISPIKDYETLINAVELLPRQALLRLRVDIIGGVGLLKQEEYLDGLKKLVKDKKLESIISFIGSVPNKNITRYLQAADFFINTSRTGSMDKAILEAMACEVPILTCNEALHEALGKYQNILMYPKGDYQELSRRIKQFIDMSQEERNKIGRSLRSIVVEEHSLGGLVNKILNKYGKKS